MMCSYLRLIVFCFAFLSFFVGSLCAQERLPKFPPLRPPEKTAAVPRVHIHQTFKAQLKTAASGTAADIESMKDQISEVVEGHINTFVERADQNDKAAKEAAEKARDSMGLHDELVAALTYELECTPMPKMERDSMRETLDDVGVHLNWDYTLAVGAIPAELKQVRVRLPEFHACGGCKQKVEQTMNGIDGFKEVVVDLKTLTLQFLINNDFDVTEKLDALEKSGLGQLTGWKRVR